MMCSASECVLLRMETCLTIVFITPIISKWGFQTPSRCIQLVFLKVVKNRTKVTIRTFVQRIFTFEYKQKPIYEFDF